MKTVDFKKEINHLSNKVTSINSTLKNILTIKIETFSRYMFFIGIFSYFFQSHSPLCSFKKNKNLLKDKVINLLKSNL